MGSLGCKLPNCISVGIIHIKQCLEFRVVRIKCLTGENGIAAGSGHFFQQYNLGAILLSADSCGKSRAARTDNNYIGCFVYTGSFGSRTSSLL